MCISLRPRYASIQEDKVYAAIPLEIDRMKVLLKGLFSESWDGESSGENYNSKNDSKYSRRLVFGFLLGGFFGMVVAGNRAGRRWQIREDHLHVPDGLQSLNTAEIVRKYWKSGEVKRLASILQYYVECRPPFQLVRRPELRSVS